MPEGDPVTPPTTAPAPAPQPTHTPAPTRDPEDEPLPDDVAPTGRNFTRIRNANRRLDDENKTLKARLTDLEATSGQLTTLRQQLIEQTVRAQATGLFVDPDDAMRFLDVDKIKVGADGKIDTKAIREQLEKVVEAKPHLKANGTRPGVTPARPLPGGGTPRGEPSGQPTAKDTVNQLIRRAAGVATE